MNYRAENIKSLCCVNAVKTTYSVNSVAVPPDRYDNNSMMSEKYKVKFERELWNTSAEIPMKDFCIRKAQDLVLEKNKSLMMMFDSEFIEMAIIDKLQDYWNKHRDLQPNHRWNCISNELDAEWFYQVSGYVKA